MHFFISSPQQLLKPTIRFSLKYALPLCIAMVCSFGSIPNSWSNTPTSADGDPPATLYMTVSQEGLALINDVDDAYTQLEDYPHDPEAYFLLAMAYSKTAYPERAFLALKKAKKYVRQHPKNFAYFDEKLDEYLVMLKAAPEDANILYRVAFAYFLKGYAVKQGYVTTDPHTPQEHYKQAIQYLETLTERHPDDTWAKNYLGYLWIETNPNQTEEAIALWEDVLKKDPNNAGAHALLAETYLTQKNLVKALEHAAQTMSGRDRGPLESLLTIGH